MRKGKTYAQMRLKKPSAMANIYASGKITVVGAKSEGQAKEAARKFARIIQKIAMKHNKICTKPGGPENICVKNYKIVNVWSSTVLPWDLKTTKIAKAYKEAQYEPEIHSDVIYQIKAPKVFHVNAAVRYIYPLLYPFKKERKTKKVKEKEQELKTRGKDKMWRSNIKI